MKTIYKITGGGQGIRTMAGETILVEQVQSDWPEKSGHGGSDSYTSTMWSEDLEALQNWARDWAYEGVRDRLKFVVKTTY